MAKIFCISGMGADERIFSNFKVPDFDPVILKWLVPEINESIEHYAKRMIEQINEEEPILLGVSFGGIMCIEISKIIKTKLIILVSTIKSRNEMPFWMRMVNKLNLHKIIKPRNYSILEPLENYNLGVTSNFEKEMVRNYRKNVDITYLDWAINVFLRWENTYLPLNYFHIHGSKDKIFPTRLLRNMHLILGGGHLMIFNKSKQINELIYDRIKYIA